MKRFENKIVLVTGGNRNTGLYIVKKFAEEGAKVYMCGSTEESTKKGAAILEDWGCAGVRSIPCDVSDLSQVKALFDVIEKEQGRLDILVNNAGITRDTLMLRMTEEDFDKVIAVNKANVFARGLINTCISGSNGDYLLSDYKY